MKQNLDIVRNKEDHSITITPPNPTSSLIWMHGLGDSSEGFFNYFLQDDSPVYNGTRITLLQAPSKAVTINGGNKCNSWYDIKSFGPGQK
jgi:phospholipase/carboxylesterase